MSFFKFLRGIGDRLGIIESVSGPGAAPERRVRTRIVTLQELAGEIKSQELCVLADSLADLSVPFGTIYETAGIASGPEDWTIEKLRQWVAEGPLRDKPREEIQRAILSRLNSAGVPVETVVRDAMARDQALDSFEACVSQKVEERKESCKRQIVEIDSRIQDLESEKRRLESRLKQEETRWLEWKQLKKMRELEMAAAVSYVVDHAVITTEDGREG
jgi:hypothetical protein